MKRTKLLLLALTFLSASPMLAYDGPIGTEAGWQTDEDGSITGTVGEKYIWVNEANFPDDNFRNFILTTTDNDTKNNMNGYGMDGVLMKTELDRITIIGLSSKDIASLDGISFFSSLKILVCNENNLTEIDVSQLTALSTLEFYRNKITHIDISKNTELKMLHCGINPLSDLDISKNTKLTYLNCNSDKLTKLDVSHNTELFYLACGGNQLTELDLSNNSKLTSAILNPQSSVIPASVLKNRAVIAIKCQTNDGKLEDYGNYTAKTINGDNYIILADENSTGDHNYWSSSETSATNDMKITYTYNTGYTGNAATEGRSTPHDLSVTVATLPYVMYVNPKAKIGDKYYGTLCLSYKAKVPEGSRCYYASGITADEELVMTEIPADKAIPARTAIYVVGEDGPGYYAFYEADATDELAVIGTNYLTGTLTGASVEARKALTLGHDNSSGALGFWNYTGTSIPAHRAYVTAETLSAAGGAKGLRLKFEDSSATGVRGVAAGSSINSDEDYYSVQGVRVDKSQLKKGVYIVNGHKVVVK